MRECERFYVRSRGRRECALRENLRGLKCAVLVDVHSELAMVGVVVEK